MSGPEKNLLDRLNALKGGSSVVSLDPSLNVLYVSRTGTELAKPPSREDTLAARLRSLRNAPERDESPKVPAPSQPQPQQQQSKASKALGQQTNREQAASLSPVISSRYGSYRSHPAASPQSQVTGPFLPAPSLAPTTYELDTLLQTDDQTLQDLLIGEALDPQEDWDVGPKEESANVNALLEELSKTLPAPHTPVEDSKGQKSNRARDENDSEGEDVTRELEILLSQALDEAKPNSQSEEASHPPLPALSGKSQDVATVAEFRRMEEDAHVNVEPGLSLPSVPSNIAALTVSGDSGGLPDLSLPSVPSGQLKHDVGSDFDKDIAARMAALSDLGAPSEGDMGLPSVPMFQPADRPVKRLASKTGYTDEDAVMWCTVCLEDATLQCLGCEDVYCRRCWHEMHVGPAAAFDDRTHEAVHFVKPKKDKEKRVALGAS